MKHQIVEEQYVDGTSRYVLEVFDDESKAWKSVYAHRDLEVIKEAKEKRETRQLITRKIVNA